MTPELLELKNSIVEDMVSYMKYGSAYGEADPDYDPNFDAGYKQEHVDQCAAIIDEFFAALAALPGPNARDAIVTVVKTAVVKLNELNELCDYRLIETVERERLCELIDLAAAQAGMESTEGDITEQWREW